MNSSIQKPPSPSSASLIKQIDFTKVDQTQGIQSEAVQEQEKPSVQIPVPKQLKSLKDWREIYGTKGQSPSFKENSSERQGKIFKEGEQKSLLLETRRLSKNNPKRTSGFFGKLSFAVRRFFSSFSKKTVGKQGEILDRESTENAAKDLLSLNSVERGLAFGAMKNSEARAAILLHSGLSLKDRIELCEGWLEENQKAGELEGEPAKMAALHTILVQTEQMVKGLLQLSPELKQSIQKDSAPSDFEKTVRTLQNLGEIVSKEDIENILSQENSPNSSRVFGLLRLVEPSKTSSD